MSIQRLSKCHPNKYSPRLSDQNVRILNEKHAILFIINSNMSSWLKYLGKESRRVHVFPVLRGAVQSPPTIGRSDSSLFHTAIPPRPCLLLLSSPPLGCLIIASLLPNLQRQGCTECNVILTHVPLAERPWGHEASARDCNATLSSLSGQFILSSAELWTWNRSDPPTQHICSHLRL